MSEPDYIAQTFEADHVADHGTMYDWFDRQGAEAKKIGCAFPRYTRSEDGNGLLFEAWKSRPSEQGAPRWRFEDADDTKGGKLMGNTVPNATPGFDTEK